MHTSTHIVNTLPPALPPASQSTDQSSMLPLLLLLQAASCMLLLTITAASAACTPLHVPAGWQLQSLVPGDQSTALSIFLSYPDSSSDTLAAHLHSPDYRTTSHHTIDTINALLNADDTASDAVAEWLNSYNVTDYQLSPEHQYITVTTTVAHANALLSTQYATYRHAQTGATVQRVASSYSIPDELDKYIDAISPTARFPAVVTPPTPASHELTPTADAFDFSSCVNAVTLSCIEHWYGFADYQPSPTSGSSIGIASYLEEYYSLNDTQQFVQRYMPAGDHSVREIMQYGSNNESDAGGEASLDLQHVVGLTKGLPVIVYYTPGRQPYTNVTTNEDFLAWLMRLYQEQPIPQVISSSYGDDESSVDLRYAQRVNIELMKLALQGTTLVFSSGDGGVGGGVGIETNHQCQRFVPAFPASSPYVLTVGGTRLKQNAETGAVEEVAVSFSGGGFSDVFEQPAWQSDAVDKYLDNTDGLPPPTYYNRSGRAYPDVSALAYRFAVYLRGQQVYLSGTSASAPLVASVIALLNDARLRQNKTALGYVNPLFYQHPDVFNDIIEGHNPGCNTQGFPATVGWDAVTGLGSVNWPRMLELVTSLP